MLKSPATAQLVEVPNEGLISLMGKRITLYKSTTRNPNGDGEVECIRVRPQIPAGKQLAEPEEAAI